MSPKAMVVIEAADEINANVVFDVTCPDCAAPLIERKGQNMPFCWLCVTNKITAQRGRTILQKVRLAGMGIHLTVCNI